MKFPYLPIFSSATPHLYECTAVNVQLQPMDMECELRKVFLWTCLCLPYFQMSSICAKVIKHGTISIQAKDSVFNRRWHQTLCSHV